MVLRLTSISISNPDSDVDDVDRPFLTSTSDLNWSLGESLVSPALWVVRADAKGRGWTGWEPLRYGKYLKYFDRCAAHVLKALNE
jgi:hypothetical protein